MVTPSCSSPVGPQASAALGVSENRLNVIYALTWRIASQ
jgi:hypothetical protein